MRNGARSVSLATAAFAAISIFFASLANAAGGAFAVDDAAVEAAGKCKVETFFSSAGNGNGAGVVTPGCVAPFFGHRAEFTAAFARTRAAGEYSSSVTIKGKTPIPGLDFAVNDKFGVAVVTGVHYDLASGSYGTGFFTIPISIRLGEQLVLLLNAGHSHDQFANLASSTWGAALEFNLKPLGYDQLTLIGEVFGHDRDSRKSAQLGLRISPISQIDIDLIYGHRLTMEAEHWFTAGMNFRF